MKSILFNAQMVQAIFARRKTQTRQLIKPQPDGHLDWMGICTDSTNKKDIGKHAFGVINLLKTFARAKYQSDDILWVRETWYKLYDINENDEFLEGPDKYYYAADNSVVPHQRFVRENGTFKDCPTWRSPIHMPFEAARLFLRVTGVRVERLWDISVEDCIAEGVIDEWSDACPKPSHVSLAHAERSIASAFRDAYRKLWDSHNAKSGYGWESNPWVWVYEFELAAGREGGTGNDV